MHGAPLSISPLELVLAGKTITGSMFGGVKAKVDIPIFANQYLNNVSFLNYDTSFIIKKLSYIYIYEVSINIGYHL